MRNDLLGLVITSGFVAALLAGCEGGRPMPEMPSRVEQPAQVRCGPDPEVVVKGLPATHATGKCVDLESHS